MSGCFVALAMMTPGALIYAVAMWIALDPGVSVEPPPPLWFLIVFWGAPLAAVLSGAVVALIESRLGVQEDG